MTSKLKQAAAKLRKSLGTKAIYCPILGIKVKACKIITCNFYKTCHGFTNAQTQRAAKTHGKP